MRPGGGNGKLGIAARDSNLVELQLTTTDAELEAANIMAIRANNFLIRRDVSGAHQGFDGPGRVPRTDAEIQIGQSNLIRGRQVILIRSVLPIGIAVVSRRPIGPIKICPTERVAVTGIRAEAQQRRHLLQIASETIERGVIGHGDDIATLGAHVGRHGTAGSLIEMKEIQCVRIRGIRANQIGPRGLGQQGQRRQQRNAETRGEQDVAETLHGLLGGGEGGRTNMQSFQRVRRESARLGGL
jgi:hypothetical protein